MGTALAPVWIYIKHGKDIQIFPQHDPSLVTAIVQFDSVGHFKVSFGLDNGVYARQPSPFDLFLLSFEDLYLLLVLSLEFGLEFLHVVIFTLAIFVELIQVQILQHLDFSLVAGFQSLLPHIE